MMSAVIAVRRAIHTQMIADVALVTLLGGPRIHDEPPRAATGPYIVYGNVEARDWSSSTEMGCEQTIEIVVWAPRSAETSVALTIAGRVGLVLHDAPLVLTDHRLVQIRQSGLDVSRDAKTGLSRAVVRLRCVTDQL